MWNCRRSSATWCSGYSGGRIASPWVSRLWLRRCGRGKQQWRITAPASFGKSKRIIRCGTQQPNTGRYWYRAHPLGDTRRTEWAQRAPTRFQRTHRRSAQRHYWKPCFAAQFVARRRLYFYVWYRHRSDRALGAKRIKKFREFISRGAKNRKTIARRLWHSFDGQKRRIAFSGCPLRKPLSDWFRHRWKLYRVRSTSTLAGDSPLYLFGRRRCSGNHPHHD